ncbi:hypothetical protein D3C74_80460 [compost metagenome]
MGTKPVRRFICSEPEMNITSNENENAGDGEALSMVIGRFFSPQESSLLEVIIFEHTKDQISSRRNGPTLPR